MATNQPPSVPPTNLWEGWHEDEVVEEIHRHREEIARRFDYDLERLYEYYSSVPFSPDVRRWDGPPATRKSPTDQS